jgi:hypothetical protein
VTIHETKVGGRVLRVDDVVKVRGLRGMFTIKSFADTDPVEVTLFGGPEGGVRMFRTVTVERIGTRKQMAGAR